MRIVVYANEWERGGQGMALYVKDAVQALFPSVKVRVESDPTLEGMKDNAMTVATEAIKSEERAREDLMATIQAMTDKPNPPQFADREPEYLPPLTFKGA